MHKFSFRVSIQVDEDIYLKNPESSELGQKIIEKSIDLIDEKGFDSFSFGKLSKAITSTEASIYRYFDGKYKLLLYLVSWYWNWMAYQMMLRLTNIQCPKERLRRAMALLTQPVENEVNYTDLDVCKLYNIVVNDSSKIKYAKKFAKDNKGLVVSGYKHIVELLEEIVLEIHPEYAYPRMLASSIIEGALCQRYFSEYLPELTNTSEGEDTVSEFYEGLTLSLLGEKVYTTANHVN